MGEPQQSASSCTPKPSAAPSRAQQSSIRSRAEQYAAPTTAPQGSEQSGSPSLTVMTPFFKAFCNETRMSIIEYLMSGEKCVCEISGLLGSSQPLISHHLAILLRAGFVNKRGQGARTYYSIDWQRFDTQLAAFRESTDALRAQDAGPSCACG